MNKVHYSSERSDWATPLDLFDRWNKKFNFTIDVCANEHNKKCKRYFSEKQNGLMQSWHDETCWMNPPYGRAIYDWVNKAFCEWLINDVATVALLPARTDTKWFHEFILPYAKIEFIKGRVKFEGAQHSAPFPSMIVIW